MPWDLNEGERWTIRAGRVGRYRLVVATFSTGYGLLTIGGRIELLCLRNNYLPTSGTESLVSTKNRVPRFLERLVLVANYGVYGIATGRKWRRLFLSLIELIGSAVNPHRVGLGVGNGFRGFRMGEILGVVELSFRKWLLSNAELGDDIMTSQRVFAEKGVAGGVKSKIKHLPRT